MKKKKEHEPREGDKCIIREFSTDFINWFGMRCVFVRKQNGKLLIRDDEDYVRRLVTPEQITWVGLGR